MAFSRKTALLATSLGLVLLAVPFIKGTLKTQSVQEKTENNDEAFEVKPVKVDVTISDGSTFRVRLENKDSVSYLLEYLRDKEGFFYEITAYTYGNELSNVNRVQLPANKMWKVYENGKDITFELKNTHLKDSGLYEIKEVDRSASLVP